jgi:hypothetical protein
VCHIGLGPDLVLMVRVLALLHRLQCVAILCCLTSRWRRWACRKTSLRPRPVAA